MKEPSLEVLDRVRGTILEFLTREDFLPLLTIFLTSQTVQGYGYLDEVRFFTFCKFSPRCQQFMA